MKTVARWQHALQHAVLWGAAVLVALLAAPLAQAALIFAVNEGVSYRVGDDVIRAKYTAIAADLSRLLRQPVQVEPVAQYPVLRKGLAERSYDLALVHPAHLSIVAMRDSGYKLVAGTKGFQQYKASFLVRADSPLKSLADLKGRKLGAPDEDSITAWMVRATLRDALGPDAKALDIVYTRYQDAVPFFVENRLTHAGATASAAVVKAWTAKGGKILFTTRPVPIKHVLASPTMAEADVAKVREYLLGLDATEAGRAKLEPTKWSGFVADDADALLKLGQWLGL